MRRVLLLTVVVFMSTVLSAAAETSWLSYFNAAYGTSGTRLSSCSICHTSVPDRNAYGADFRTQWRQLGNVTSALRAIEGMDSDGDKVHNLIEIQHLTFPGDGSDTAPTRGATWGAVKALYN